MTTTTPTRLPRVLRGPARQEALDAIAHAWARYLEDTAEGMREAERDGIERRRIDLDRSFIFGVLLRRAEAAGHDRLKARYRIGDQVTDALIEQARNRAAGLVRTLRRAGEDLGPEAPLS